MDHVCVCVAGAVRPCLDIHCTFLRLLILSASQVGIIQCTSTLSHSCSPCFPNIDLSLIELSEISKYWISVSSVSSCQHDTLPFIFSRSYCYERLLASSCCPSVCLSVCLWRCALWLSGLVYTAKSCSSVFLVGMFLFVPSDTFAVGCIV